MANEFPVERAVEVLVADYMRQGGRLDLDQVNRVLERRGLSADQAATVLSTLAAEGIEVTGVDPSMLGFEPSRSIPASIRGHADAFDGLRIYLKDIGRYRLLTAEDERKLGRRIELGRQALGELEKRFGLTAKLIPHDADALAKRFHAFEAILDMEGGDDPNDALLKQVRDGKDAFDHLLTANLRLVVSIAKGFSNQGLDLLDLIQEGSLGLVRAAEKFDASLGYKFSTYATWWIRQAISRALANQGRTIRLPVHVQDTKRKLDRVRRSLQAELGRDPTLAELAMQLNWDVAMVAAIEDLARLEVTSLDAPINAEGDQTLADLVLDPYSIDPAEVAMRASLYEALDSVLADLTDREREVIELRFGLDGNEVRTLEEVGQEFGVTRERIRQIQEKALKALRAPARMARLQEFADVGGSDVEGFVEPSVHRTIAEVGEA